MDLNNVWEDKTSRCFTEAWRPFLIKGRSCLHCCLTETYFRLPRPQQEMRNILKGGRALRLVARTDPFIATQEIFTSQIQNWWIDLWLQRCFPSVSAKKDDLDRSHVWGMRARQTLSKHSSLSWRHGNVRSSGWKDSPISDISNMVTVAGNTAAGFISWLEWNQPKMMLRLKKEFYLV